MWVTKTWHETHKTYTILHTRNKDLTHKIYTVLHVRNNDLRHKTYTNLHMSNRDFHYLFPGCLDDTNNNDVNVYRKQQQQHVTDVWVCVSPIH